MDKEELINRYFENTLDEAGLKELERLYQSDPDFAAELDFEKELQGALKTNERQELREMFREKRDAERAAPSKVVRLRPWLMAASIVFLVGISAWLLFFNSTGIDTEALYNTHFSPYENVVHPIERGEQLEDLKTKAFTAYEEGDYALALSLFKDLQDKSNDDYIKFYEAIALMQLNKHSDAVALLETYIRSDGELKNRAEWYLALSYLRLDQVDKSTSLLKNVADHNGFKAKEARKLLEELD
ncbi:tetratricopeptide repeat protein [Pseudozobellia thermophila]|uniref:Tetratricopeptide repeat-containing protein n=1 Tax=Pseudozobellia thermophila TaxID=192903 RepID=A0A1M6C2L0_9FLAO|nr:tetratricopeptide repeat protein [Pseudozobellia thermophila]SHI55051.1 Tetratricopeptide repeat-containing protein [Pseudozobellia thermophila]